MSTRAIESAVAVTALTVGLTASHAQTAPAPSAQAPEKSLSPTEQWIKDVKQPVDWLNWGADLRLRNEYVNNATTLDNEAARHEQDYFRFRGRAYLTVTPVKDFAFNTRIAAEPREWMTPSYVGAYAGRQGLEWRYGIIDSLNFRWKTPLETPLTLTVGRQEIYLGENRNWWLVADGTPGDGSWTMFFDAARMTLDLKDANTKIDAVGLYQNADPGAWIPTVGNSTGYNLTDQDEVGGILYLSNKSIKDTQLDAYFIYKGDNVQYKYGDNADIYTVGARVSGDVTENWGYSVEGAYQFGNKQLTDALQTPAAGHTISAWGINSRVSYKLNDEMKNEFKLICEYLSGRDPNSSNNGQFDVLWGRYPRWSDTYVFAYGPETGRSAQYGNVIRVGPGWSLTPVKKLDCSVSYNALFADQAWSDPDSIYATAAKFGTGTFRGHYFIASARYKFTDHMSALLVGEAVWMGDFYANRDVMSFLRAELNFTF